MLFTRQNGRVKKSVCDGLRAAREQFRLVEQPRGHSQYVRVGSVVSDQFGQQNGVIATMIFELVPASDELNDCVRFILKTNFF